MDDIGLVDLLDAAIEQNEKEKELTQEKIFPLRPSSAGKCSRAIYFDLMAFQGKLTVTKEKMTPEVIRLLDLGHFVEDSMIKQFNLLEKQFGVKVKYKQQILDLFELSDGTIISGSCDFALEGNNLKILCDSKSTKDGFSAYFRTRWDENISKWRSFSSLKEVSSTAFVAENVQELIGELGDDFKIDNLVQLNLYLGAPFFRTRKYEYGSLLYYVKNDSRIFELRFRFSQDLFSKTIEKLVKIYSAEDYSQVPKEFAYGSIRCAYCPYNNTCWQGDAKKEYYNTYPNKGHLTHLAFIEDAGTKEELTKVFSQYEEYLTSNNKERAAEKNILNLLSKHNINKIRLENGNIYEVKQLKTPKPHSELRRSK